jgi:hypothetical protein
MCAAEGAPAPPQRIVFSKAVRCCTYRPQLSNFAVGAVLAGSGESAVAAQASIRQRLAEGEATPMGLRINAAYQLVYRHANASSFGRAEQLRCPHQTTAGQCSIWAQRPAVCATWHCKYERGEVAARMWRSLHQTLAVAEHAAALWCLQELGFDTQARRAALDDLARDQLDAYAVDRRIDEARAQRLWGEWAGREPAFFAACAEKVATLEWSAIEQQCGQELTLLAAQTRDLHEQHLDLSLPQALRAGRFEVLGSTEGRLWLRSYSEFDTLEVAPELMVLVARCDGRGTQAICAEHEAATGQRPSRVLLRMLLDFAVLQEA